MDKNELIIEISKTFGLLLYEELGWDFLPVAERSQKKSEKYHSEIQDMCDANIILMNAVCIHTKQVLFDEYLNQETIDLLNEVWEHSEKNNFYVKNLQAYRIWKNNE